MSRANNIYALLDLMVEETGATRIACLDALAALANGAQVAAPSPLPVVTNGVGKPFDSHRFREHLRVVKPGTKMTAYDAVQRLHMVWPKSSKIPAYAMLNEGWARCGKRDGHRLYVKPAEQAA